ncbi:MAG TPA: hypothetical protein VHZ25_17755 [Acidobacteriaceae bacterium]|nr:hypothetical protein [Acidobacteriaceae bacterium]
MQAIFPIVGALAFIEIIGKMGEKVYELAQQWNPVYQAEQRVIETAKAMQTEIAKLGEELQRLDSEALTRAIGKPAAAVDEADKLLRTKITADKVMIASLNLELQTAQQAVEAAKQAQNETDAGMLLTARDAALKDIVAINAQLSAFQVDLEVQERRSQALIAEGAQAQIKQNEQAEKAAEKASGSYYGLTSVLDSLKSKIADNGTAWDKLANEVARYQEESAKAQTELKKLEKAGTITSTSVRQQTAALAQIPALIGQLVAQTTEKIKQAELTAWGEAVTKSAEVQEEFTYQQQKAGEARVEVDREIHDRMATNEAQSYDQQRSRFIEQQNAWAASLAKKTALTDEEWAEIEQITADGLAKIDRTQTTAWEQEIRKLQQHLDSVVASVSTGQDKISAQYQKDLAQYSDVELQKSLLTAKSEAERASIRQQYATITTAITKKYQNDLTTLLNSQGWQGVFGSGFAQMIRGNAQLYQQWEQSADQSLLMVKMSLEALNEMAQKAFQSMVQAMGQSITQAFVYEKSIGQAMRSALASVLESFAGQAAAAALMAAAWGFYDLAFGDYADAALDFTSAGIFAAVGGAAALAGRAIAPSQNASSASATTAAAASGASDAAASTGAASSTTPQPTVHVYISGPIVGMNGGQQLADIINQAVYNNDVTLYASHNAQGVPLG